MCSVGGAPVTSVSRLGDQLRGAEVLHVVQDQHERLVEAPEAGQQVTDQLARLGVRRRDQRRQRGVGGDDARVADRVQHLAPEVRLVRLVARHVDPGGRGRCRSRREPGAHQRRLAAARRRGDERDRAARPVVEQLEEARSRNQPASRRGELGGALVWSCRPFVRVGER